MSISETVAMMPSPVVKYGDDRDRPLPELQILQSATATAEAVVAALVQSGGCVVKNLIHADGLAEIEKDTRPYLNAADTWEGSFFPKETRRVTALAEKSTAFMETIVGNKLYQDLCKIMLRSTVSNWLGDEQKISTSYPQVNSTFILSVGPGARAQGLHRDSTMHHMNPTRKTAEEYQIGQDPEIGIFVCAKRTTKANGATRFIPGSHLWDPDTPPTESLTRYVELQPGDAFFMLPSCLHGGSTNTTKDEERLLYGAFMTKSYLRQEENQYLTNNHEKLKKLQSTEMLKLLGYDLSRPFLGWIQSGNPLTALFEPAEKGKTDYY
ncbi:hypothetical protein A1O3_07796 [Capronia epimyces CBS 606.96]|uniref:Phytanoyl-CoA dioxygenase n=1 Tax=Capronia epimyces CBS 606.96 TaxID=1182542 RepID=W9XG83_9EURO|nr:uncharacterized protein A1O3_07796 [Capronia epimyces CBS 606.96]EXJ79517.1 hypothetical protein A1O3_07796 [Capronia epimyces CBS 606.96]